MQIQAYKTALFYSKSWSLNDFLAKFLPPLKEKDILVVTSKIVSIDEKCMHSCSKEGSKKQLIIQESDSYLLEKQDFSTHSQSEILLTIKNGMLIPAAGVDESNIESGCLTLPPKPYESAKRIWKWARSYYKINELGVIISDSTTRPLRKGVTGISIGWCGFEPIYSYINKLDCFQKPLKHTIANYADALAAAAVFTMGEGNERTPIALIKDAPHITFVSYPPNEEECSKTSVSKSEDLYAPCFGHLEWVESKIKPQNRIPSHSPINYLSS